MSYDLLSKKVGHIKLSIHTWPKLLDLARMYGWEPSGTKFDEGIHRKMATELAPRFMSKKQVKKQARAWVNHPSGGCERRAAWRLHTHDGPVRCLSSNAYCLVLFADQCAR